MIRDIKDTLKKAKSRKILFFVEGMPPVSPHPFITPPATALDPGAGKPLERGVWFIPLVSGAIEAEQGRSIRLEPVYQAPWISLLPLCWLVPGV